MSTLRGRNDHLQSRSPAERPLACCAGSAKQWRGVELLHESRQERAVGKDKRKEVRARLNGEGKSALNDLNQVFHALWPFSLLVHRKVLNFVEIALTQIFFPLYTQ